MKLIDLLVQELPKHGGWPEGAESAQQSAIDKEVYFQGDCTFCSGVFLSETAHDESEAIITREQHEAALQQPVWNGEGLPPVGCKFEYGSHRTVATCLGVGFDMVFAWKGNPLGEDYEEFMISIKDSSFYAARTEAERKRDKFITAIGNEDVIGTYITKDDAELIYDAIAAGKIPGVTLL